MGHSDNIIANYKRAKKLAYENLIEEIAHGCPGVWDAFVKEEIQVKNGSEVRKHISDTKPPSFSLNDCINFCNKFFYFSIDQVIHDTTSTLLFIKSFLIRLLAV
jgi:hypothetical protein